MIQKFVSLIRCVLTLPTHPSPAKLTSQNLAIRKMSLLSKYPSQRAAMNRNNACSKKTKKREREKNVILLALERHQQ